MFLVLYRPAGRDNGAYTLWGAYERLREAADTADWLTGLYGKAVVVKAEPVDRHAEALQALSDRKAPS